MPQASEHPGLGVDPVGRKPRRELSGEDVDTVVVDAQGVVKDFAGKMSLHVL